MRLIDTGPYLYRLEGAPDPVFDTLNDIYGLAGSDDQRPADFRIRLGFDAPLRRFLSPQITFFSDQNRPFKPVELAQAYPLLEWGMNWCVAAYDHHRLIIHSAVLVRNGKAILFPALPGSGKSTLAAYLALNGWELFSDETAIISLRTGQVSPVFRPICLKNQSIDLVRDWFPKAKLTQRFKDTVKGDVSHLQVSNRDAFAKLKPTTVQAIVFPKYTPDVSLEIYAMTRTDGFAEIVEHAFNYTTLGKYGFDSMAQLIESTVQVKIRYNDLAEVADYLAESFSN